MSPEQRRKKEEARKESEYHAAHNVVGQKPALANEDSARGRETNSYDKDEIANSGAVGGGV